MPRGLYRRPCSRAGPLAANWSSKRAGERAEGRKRDFNGVTPPPSPRKSFFFFLVKWKRLASKRGRLEAKKELAVECFSSRSRHNASPLPLRSGSFCSSRRRSRDLWIARSRSHSGGVIGGLGDGCDDDDDDDDDAASSTRCGIPRCLGGGSGGGGDDNMRTRSPDLFFSVLNPLRRRGPPLRGESRWC